MYKQLTSCSSSSSSDDELKELQLGGRDRAVQRSHVRHKPPQKERRVVSLPSTSPDDDEVFSYSKPGCMSKRLKCSAPQPIPGRYTDFDKMRKTPMLQVSKVRREGTVGGEMHWVHVRPHCVEGSAVVVVMFTCVRSTQCME